MYSWEALTTGIEIFQVIPKQIWNYEQIGDSRQTTSD